MDSFMLFGGGLGTIISLVVVYLVTKFKVSFEENKKIVQIIFLISLVEEKVE